MDKDIWVSEKARTILNVLFEQEEPVVISYLEQNTKLSRRMIHYGLNEIEYIFKKLGFGDAIFKQGEIYLTEEQKRKYKIWLPLRYQFQTKELRIYYIICRILYRKQNIFIKDLMDVFDMSKNAVLYNLSQAKKIFEGYEIEIKTSKKTGYYAIGSVLNCRTLFMKCFCKLTETIDYKALDILDEEEVEKYSVHIENISQDLGMHLSQKEQMRLVYLLVCIHGISGDIPVQLLDSEYVKECREWKLIDARIPEMPSDEKLYFSLVLLDMQNDQGYILKNPDAEQRLGDFTRRLIESFDRLICVDALDKAALYESIYRHVKLSYYRYCFLIPQNFVLENSIRSQYEDLFLIVYRVYQEVKEYSPFVLDEAELAYITIYFAVALLKNRGNTKKVNILICCNNNISSSQLLYAEIEREFENIHVVEMIALNELDRYIPKEEINFVIATDKIECQYPLLRVHAILTDEDRANIQTFMALFNMDRSGEKSQLQEFLRIVKKHVDIKTYQNIKEDIQLYLNTGQTLVNTRSKKAWTLVEALEKYGIKIFTDKLSWKEMLYSISEPLLEDKCIEKSFIENIFQMTEKYGAYFVITDQIAVAHAKPEAGACKLGLTLGICREGVTIKEYTNVQLLFLLSTPDNKEQLSIIKNILEFSDNPKAVKDVANAEEEEDALYIFYKLFNK